MRKTLVLALIVLASGCISTTDSSQTVTVTDVVDGDTMDIRYANGSTDKLRLLGVDTPEKYGEVNPEEFNVPDNQQGRDCLKDWAYNASSYAEQLDDQNVTLRQDKVQDLRGGYDRLLAYLHFNDSEKSFNYKLVENGYARVYESRFAEKQNFFEAEERARSNNIGVWSCRKN